MQPDFPTKIKIALLTTEMEEINFVDSLYWKCGKTVSTEAKAEYERRQKRLEEISDELEKTLITYNASRPSMMARR
jgi:hypothetical protein